MGPKQKVRTRKKSGDVGAPTGLPDAGVLFVNKDIIAAINNELETNPNMSVQMASVKVNGIVVQKFMELNPLLTLLSEKAIITKMKRLHADSVKFKSNKMSPKQKQNFKEKLTQLFDIIACKCETINCGGGKACRDEKNCTGFHILCECPEEERIPEKDIRFIKDQREKTGLHGGEMIMDGKDVKEAKLLQEEAKKEEKKIEKDEKKVKAARKVEENIRRGKREAIKTVKDSVAEALETETADPLERDDDFEPKGSDTNNNSETRISLGPFVAELCRYSGSDRAGSAYWNAVIKCLEDADLLKKSEVGSITENLTVDRSKIRRAKGQFAARQKDEQKTVIENTGGLECFGSDGKRNKKTRMRKTIRVNNVETVKFFTGTEEHVVYTKEPGGEYLCHSAVENGTGRGLATDALEVLAETNSLKTVKAVCCDGTNVNTGWREGMFAHIERDLGRKLLLCSCLAHANELPFRKLFDWCDGGFGTTGPTSFGGDMGERCKHKLHLEDVVVFAIIETELEDIDEEVVKDLSRDQNLLYSYIKAVAAGRVPAKLATQVAGPLNHSRWLTLAIRLLQLYTRTSNPPNGLKTVVRFIQTVYGPCWFMIKQKRKFTFGPAIVFHQMSLIKTQRVEVQSVVKPVVQRNAYMAEPGIMLCSMLESESSEVRKKAVDIVLRLKSKPPKKPRMKVLRSVRALKVPVLQWDATTWVDIIDWSKASVHVPFIIECLSQEELTAALEKPHLFPAFPVHTQSVERAVKLVTEASSQVCGEEKRHEFILSVIKARKIRKPFDTKKDYKIDDSEV